MNDQKPCKRVLYPLLITVFFLLPAVSLLSLLQTFSDMPSVDYWTAADQLLTKTGLRPFTLKTYFIRLNEHVMPLTGFIYAMNIWLYGGSNIALIFVGFLASFFSVFVLFKLLPIQIRDGCLLSLFAAFFISSLIFSPASYTVWYEGFSSVHWYVANIFMFVALFFFHRAALRKEKFSLGISLLSSMLACFTYSSAYVLWPVLLVLAFFYRMSFRQILLIFIAMVPIALFGVYYAYFFGLEVSAHPVHDPQPLTLNPLVVGKYFLTYLGAYFFNFQSFFKNQIHGHLLVALPGLVLFCVLSLLSLFRRVESHYPWIGIAAIALGNALLTAVVRGGFGLGMIISPRFKCISALFWLALGVLILCWCLHFIEERGKKFKLIPIGVVLLFIVMHTVLMRGTYQQEIRKRAHEMTMRNAAAISYRLNTLDEKIFSHTVTQNISQMKRLRGRLEKFHHVPFYFKKNSCSPLPTASSQVQDSTPLLLVAGKSVSNGRRVFVKEKFSDLETLCLYSKDKQLVGILEQDAAFRSTRSKGKQLSGYLKTPVRGDELLTISIKEGHQTALPDTRVPPSHQSSSRWGKLVKSAKEG